MRKSSHRICIVRHSFFPKDIRVSKEARTLCEAGFSVDIICLRENGQKSSESLDGINVYRVMSTHRRGSPIRYMLEYGISFFLMTLRLTSLFFRRRYSCIQVNTMPDFLVFITLIPRLFGTKILLDMHEPVPELWQTKFDVSQSSLFVKLQIKIEQWAIKYAHHVITVNETIKQRFIERGAAKQKMGVVRNVPDEVLISHPTNQVSKNGFTLLIHGTLERHWGHEIIIKALPILGEKIKSLKLFIIGDGKYKIQLHNLIEQSGCSDMVTLTGWIPHSQIPGYIAGADVGLVTNLPSPFAELCQPLKLFEYVALKKPVITPKLKAIEETFDSESVMFFEAGNEADLARCVQELYENPAKGEELAANAYTRYEMLKWNKTKHDYVKVIQNLTSLNHI